MENTKSSPISSLYGSDAEDWVCCKIGVACIMGWLLVKCITPHTFLNCREIAARRIGPDPCLELFIMRCIWKKQLFCRTDQGSSEGKETALWLQSLGFGLLRLHAQHASLWRQNHKSGFVLSPNDEAIQTEDREKRCGTCCMVDDDTSSTCFHERFQRRQFFLQWVYNLLRCCCFLQMRAWGFLEVTVVRSCFQILSWGFTLLLPEVPEPTQSLFYRRSLSFLLFFLALCDHTVPDSSSRRCLLGICHRAPVYCFRSVPETSFSRDLPCVSRCCASQVRLLLQARWIFLAHILSTTQKRRNRKIHEAWADQIEQNPSSYQSCRHLLTLQPQPPFLLKSPLLSTLLCLTSLSCMRALYNMLVVGHMQLHAEVAATAAPPSSVQKTSKIPLVCRSSQQKLLRTSSISPLQVSWIGRLFDNENNDPGSVS